MKILNSIIVLIATQNLMAQCLGEAQIISQVKNIKEINAKNCVVEIEPSSIIHYNESRICPLDLSNALINGVNIGLTSVNTCSLNAGDQLSGVLVLKPDGIIELE